MKVQILIFFILSTLICSCYAESLSLTVCQCGCRALLIACYASAKFASELVTGHGSASFAMLFCKTSFGTCISTCTATGCAPLSWTDHISIL